MVAERLRRRYPLNAGVQVYRGRQQGWQMGRVLEAGSVGFFRFLGVPSGPAVRKRVLDVFCFLGGLEVGLGCSSPTVKLLAGDLRTQMVFLASAFVVWAGRWGGEVDLEI